VRDISLAQARAVVRAAQQQAEQMGLAMNIAVVDRGGNLKAFARMDEAWLGSIDISIKKARTARFFDMPTGDIGEFSQPGRPRGSRRAAFGEIRESVFQALKHVSMTRRPLSMAPVIYRTGSLRVAPPGSGASGTQAPVARWARRRSKPRSTCPFGLVHPERASMAHASGGLRRVTACRPGANPDPANKLSACCPIDAAPAPVRRSSPPRRGWPNATALLKNLRGRGPARCGQRASVIAIIFILD
jgi:hypothetical protein